LFAGVLSGVPKKWFEVNLCFAFFLVFGDYILRKAWRFFVLMSYTPVISFFLSKLEGFTFCFTVVTSVFSSFLLLAYFSCGACTLFYCSRGRWRRNTFGGGDVPVFLMVEAFAWGYERQTWSAMSASFALESFLSQELS